MAYRSWLPIFDRIIYVGNEEQELKHHKVVFCPSEQFPKISDLVKIAAQTGRPYSVILNGDIILGPAFKSVLELMVMTSAKAGLSRRLNFDKKEGIRNAQFTDLGLDVFVAQPEVWRKMYRQVPKDYRIGHIMWDTWCSGYFNRVLKGSVVDFSHFRCVFHPNHEGRKRPFEVTTLSDENTVKASIPGRRL